MDRREDSSYRLGRDTVCTTPLQAVAHQLLEALRLQGSNGIRTLPLADTLTHLQTAKQDIPELVVQFINLGAVPGEGGWCMVYGVWCRV